MLDAVGLAPEAASTKYIDINFFGAGLKSANEMARQADSGNRQLQATRQKKVKRAEADRTPSAPVHYPV